MNRSATGARAVPPRRMPPGPVLVALLAAFGVALPAPRFPERTVRRIVVLDSSRDDLEGAADELTARCRGVKGHVYTSAIDGFSIELPATELWRLQRDPRVRFVSEDRKLFAQDQSVPSGISRIDGELNATARIGSGMQVDADIAVLDTGVFSAHPDLNVYRTVSFVLASPGGEDGHGHGTHVAGIAAARDNDEFVVGVAPGARIWSVKVLGDFGFGLASDIVAGVDYVTANASEIDVVNMSLGGIGPVDDGNCGLTVGDALHQAICNSVAAGVVYVVAAGNSARNASTQVPASYDEVIAVSAIVDTDGLPGGLGPSTTRGPDDALAFFSNFGEDVDLAAPGVEVLSTWNDGGTARKSGTSMAAPHVAGAAALYIAKHGKPTDATEVAAVRQALVGVGYAQSGPDGFAGDPDNFAEPLLNSLAIDPAPASGFDLVIEIDVAPEFNTFYELSAPLRIFVRDEGYSRVQGLAPSAFAITLDGQPRPATVDEVAPGIYEAQLDISGAAPGSHALDVAVTDTRQVTRSRPGAFQTVSFEPSPGVSLDLATDRLSYNAYFASAGILLTARVRDELARPIAGLAPAAFDATPAGGVPTQPIVFVESASPGVYTAAVALNNLSNGSHGFYLEVTDPRDLTGTAVVNYYSTDAILLGGANVSIIPQQPDFDSRHGDVVVLLATVTRENGAVLSGIGFPLFSFEIDGLRRSTVRFVETPMPGQYEARLDLGSLSAGLHGVQITYHASATQSFMGEGSFFAIVPQRFRDEPFAARTGPVHMGRVGD